MFKQKILITGASGFIGSHLVEHLIKNGQSSESLRLLIPPWESQENIPNRIFNIAITDIRDKKAVDNAIKGIDVIYHLAAKTIIPNVSYSYYKDTNVDGTVNLLNAAQKYGIKKFIFFSSISVFGLPAWKGDMINIDENSPKTYSEPYGRTKLEAEKEVIKACKKYKIPYIIIRPTTVYGPRDKAGIYQLLQAINSNYFIFIGDAKNKMDYVYVGDLVRAARTAEKSNIVNDDFIVGADRPIIQRDLVKIAADALGKSVPKVYIPKSLAIFISYFIQYISNIFHIRPLLFSDRVKVLTSSCYFDSTKARKLLGYCPNYSFERGVNITIKWMRQQKILK